MGGDKAVANSQVKSEDLIFEKLDGELDAAAVFAAAALEAEQNGQLTLAQSCRADAAEAYALVRTCVAQPGFTESQRQRLEAKLGRLRQLLERPRTVRTANNEAA